MKKPFLINVGCGDTFHPAWENIDLVPRTESIRKVDILRGLPYRSASVDACYSSHVLEHLRKRDAGRFVGELFRILKSGGLIRVVVPDLESICANYLRHLDYLASGQSNNDLCYDFAVLELFDQVTRESSGGELYRFLRDLPKLNETQRSYLNSRFRLDDFEKIIQLPPEPANCSVGRKIVNRWSALRYRAACFVIKLLLGNEAVGSFRRGLFRDCGEIHHIMYDRYSLARLLSQQGFVSIRKCDAGQSGIPDFDSHSLEISNEVILKPDSLFMEASKP